MTASAITDSSATSTSTPPTFGRGHRHEAAGEREHHVPQVRERPVRAAPERLEARIATASSRAPIAASARPAARRPFPRRARRTRPGRRLSPPCSWSGHGRTPPMADTQDDLLAVAHEAARAAARRARPRASAGASRTSARRAARPTPCPKPTWRRSGRARGARRAPPERHGDRRGGGSDPRLTSALRWVVDPLDGTVNFLFGIPAVRRQRRVRGRRRRARRRRARPDPRRVLRGDALGAGRDPERRADRGLDHCSELATAMVATGFGYDAAMRAAAGRDRRPGAPGGPRHPARAAPPRSISAGRLAGASTRSTSAG